MRPFRSSFLVLLSIAAAGPVLAAIPPSERAALIAIYNSTGGTTWNSADNWNGAAGTECSWERVRCNQAETAVVELELGYNHLTGSLPAQIGDFPSLERLILVGNELTGPIPSGIGRLTSLRELNLGGYYNNQFSGSIPPSLGNLSRLVRLVLNANDLSGPIPPELGQLSALEELDLEVNSLSGEVPPSLLALPNLRILNLSANDLSGPLPVPSSARLAELYLHENAFSGSIPAALGARNALVKIDLSSNRLTGSIPPELGSLAELVDLRLHNNPLSGEIPGSLGSLSKLEFLAISSSRVSGPLPTSLASLSALRELHLEANDLSGAIPPELARLAKLEVLHLHYNSLSGAIPPELGTMSAIRAMTLEDNELTGEIPRSFAGLANIEELTLSSNLLTGTVDADLVRNWTKIRRLYLSNNRFGGAFPPVTSLTTLEWLLLDRNRFSGTIPREVAQLSNLRGLFLGSNAFEGTIPAEVLALPELEHLLAGDNRLTGSLPTTLPPKMWRLDLSGNRYSGGIPSQYGDSATLRELDLSSNELTGEIPGTLGRLTELVDLRLGQNHFSGSIPPALGTLPKLRRLFLDGNRLGGTIPPELGNLGSLRDIDISRNQLRGPVPRELMNLTSLDDRGSNFGENALYTTDPALAAFLDAKQYTGSFAGSQTVAPANVAVGGVRADAVTLTWEPILYTSNPGGYQISVAYDPAGPYAVLHTTPSKDARVATVTGLLSSRTHYFRVAAATYPNASQQNLIVSDPTAPVSATTLPPVPAPPQIVVLRLPDGLVQRAAAGGDLDAFTLANVGDLPTTLSLATSGDFFTVDSASLTVAGSEDRSVTITAAARDVGAYYGSVIITGEGTGSGITIPVSLLVVPPPASGEPEVRPATNRVDVAAPAGENPGGEVRFTNSGTGTMTGIATSDVAWLIPQRGLIVIQPGESVTVSFTIDRALRADQNGTAIGKLSLVYVEEPSSAPAREPMDGGSSTAAVTVTIADTVKPRTTIAGIPELPPGEVALFVPGVGNVQGSSGRFLSDLAITNATGAASVSDVRIFYVSAMTYGAAAPAAAEVPAITPAGGVQLADVVKSVFDSEGQIGTVQIRSASVNTLVATAEVFNVSNPRGTYGNAIPVFRSDRAIAAGASLYLAGLRKDSTTHSNLFVQETAGRPATFEVEFFGAGGDSIPVPNGSGGTAAVLTGSVDGFRLRPLFDAAPEGAVAARIRNSSADGGRIVAYATPVDRQSGDTWSVVDWRGYFGGAAAETLIVPIAGSVHGANDNFFRTDIALSNDSGSPAGGTLSYYPRGRSPVARDVDLSPGQTLVLNDVIGSAFTGAAESYGMLRFVPSAGNAVIASRTFATIGSVSGSFGTGVPTLSAGSTLRAGQSRIISDLEVARPSTITRQKPATFRTNLGLMETSGLAPATVRITATFPEFGQLAQGRRRVEFDIELTPNAFVLVTDLSDRIAATIPVGDLRNVQVQFKVTGGDGAVTVFTSSVDNGSGDQVLRIE